MASKKYIVRDGFVLLLVIKKADGDTYERRHEGGEEVTLDDEQAGAHAHKLEFASDKDRAAAVEAERKAAIAAAAGQSPAQLVQMLVEALSAAQAGAAVAPAIAAA